VLDIRFNIILNSSPIVFFHKYIYLEVVINVVLVIMKGLF
jgi:hypothetical protein